MTHKRVTRGFGLLEEKLAQLRADRANSLIPSWARSGCILDIGSGTTPVFLQKTEFQHKFGIEKNHSIVNDPLSDGITMRQMDLAVEKTLPFDEKSIDVVTMLAVLEHIEVERVIDMIVEVRRILKRNGIFILTVPAGWTDPILRLLARCRIVSELEVKDHKDRYNRAKLATILETGGFKKEHTKSGYFEFGMNIWLKTIKA